MNGVRVLFVNARILMAPMTGVQRYLTEMLAAWPEQPPLQLQPPSWSARGVSGHAWEQLVLPRRTRGALLWSPVHSGPVMLEAQVVTVHDIVPLDHPEWLHPRFARWYRWMLPRLMTRARHVIAISNFTRNRLIACTGIDGDRVSVIHSGVGSGFLADHSQDATPMRQSFGLGGCRYVLSLGALEPRKNLGALIAAWQQALPNLPDDLDLVIAGGVGRQSVFGHGPELDRPERVVFLGRVEDRWLPALYSEAEWFVYPSLYEGFGLPPLEAMACGTPVILNDIEVFREVSGEAAVMVDATNPRALADALSQALTDPDLRETHARRAREVAARYRWEDAALSTARLLQRFS